MTKREFKGWETELSPDNLNLLSILTFRRSKSDFSFDKMIEHTAISTFVSYVAKISKDKKWMKAASNLSETFKVNIFLSIVLTREVGLSCRCNHLSGLAITSG
jgi:hypothetical protein